MIAYLALGSNRGERARELQAALEEIERAGMRVRRVSRPVMTRPQAATGRGWFLNAVAEVETELLPRVLLHRLQAIERAHRRRRQAWPRKNTPRRLDLDVIFYGRVRLSSRELKLPHPRWRGRAFVVEGLRELSASLGGRAGLGGRGLPGPRPGAAGWPPWPRPDRSA
ncbi:MAG: 2-amino-4-hydroxy-6-hydroxymethyldihydropteridine diphosphokinase [Terriglobales bacterium]